MSRDFSSVGLEEALRRAGECVPVLRERAQKCEDARVLLPENEKLLHETGHAISTVNLDLEDLPIREMLTEEVRLPVAIDNDGNLAMLAEALYGAARGTRHALLLTIGTGIGGGIWRSTAAPCDA